jgi:hypothetical protein
MSLEGAPRPLLLLAPPRYAVNYYCFCLHRVEACKCRLTNASAANYLPIDANVRSVQMQTN